ncbi:MAG TPA: WXG100 family type VII secretion target, partial [Pseudonocardiaceae bacterium]|nr:WXG100 family type VII secretion target [Pseudonocardiaceae bacterium]
MSDGTYPRWSTVRPLLDDPSVSGADKTRLLTDYAQQAAYDNPISGTVNQDYVDHMADIARYAQRYHATDAFRDVTALHGPFGDGSAPAPGQRVFLDQLARARNSQQVGQAKVQLADEAKRTVAHGGAGVRTSDELLEPGSRGLYFFQYFIPAYRDWTGNAPDPRRDIRDVYDNLRGIQFAKFRADAAQLSTSHGKLSDSTLNLATATGSLGGFWQGAAAEAAQRYCGSFVRHAQTVSDGVTAASQVITTSMKAIEAAVLQRAQGVLPLYATDIGGVTPDGVQQLIDIAKHRADDDELRSVSTWDVFHNVDWGDTDCHGKLSQNVKNLAAQDATKWLNGTFVPTFDRKKQSFDSITRSTHDTVSQSFDAMNQGLAKINANPFGDPGQDVETSGSPAVGGSVAGG